MRLLQDGRQRALVIILTLGLGLVVAMAPFATGLIGGMVLYVVLRPVYDHLRPWSRPTLAASTVVLVALLLIAVPGLSFAGLIVAQAQQIAGGVIQGTLLSRLAAVQVGGYDIGSELARLGNNVVSWLGTSAFAWIGTATRMVLNLAIALFCLFFLLLRPDEAWNAVRPYIPFSPANTDRLRQRFRDVTTSTLIGTGLTALVQGALVAGAFWAVGLSNAAFWGVVTVVFAILPVVGSGVVWVPAVAVLGLDDRWGAAAGLAIWGLVVIANVDNVIRPLVFRRWAKIHPLVTLMGALAGVPYFGILGLLIGPLALSYFFELVRMYREEYVDHVVPPARGPGPPPAPSAPAAATAGGMLAGGPAT